MRPATEAALEAKTFAVIQTSAPDSIVVACARLNEDLGLDSLDRVEIAMGLEEEFDLDFPDDVIEGWRTVADVLASVQEAAKK